jgi:hypothetical protein
LGRPTSLPHLPRRVQDCPPSLPHLTCTSVGPPPKVRWCLPLPPALLDAASLLHRFPGARSSPLPPPSSRLGLLHPRLSSDRNKTLPLLDAASPSHPGARAGFSSAASFLTHPLISLPQVQAAAIASPSSSDPTRPSVSRTSILPLPVKRMSYSPSSSADNAPAPVPLLSILHGCFLLLFCNQFDLDL